MKVNAIKGYTPSVRSAKAANACANLSQASFSGLKVVSLSDYMRTKSLSFTGKNRNKEQAIFIGAESDPWSKAGGVGTVMKDYRSMLDDGDSIEITPYYGAVTGSDGKLSPLKNSNGDPILKSKKGDIVLRQVATKKMQWGKDKESEISVYAIKDDQNPTSYFILTDGVSTMKKPYQEPKEKQNYTYAAGSKAATNDWNGDPYAKFSKAAVELLPEILEYTGKDFDPATIICSDSQTAYVEEYMAQKSLDKSDENPYYGIKPTYVGHNLGPGYCGETSKQNMFVNLGATPEQIEKVESDPLYKDLGDEYFTPLIEGAIDETGTASAVMIPIHYAKEGYSPMFTTVAEEYAKNIAENPQAAHNIHNSLKELYEKGKFDGILNPLNDPDVDPTKPLPHELYNKNCKDKDDTVYPKFETYPENPTYEEMREIKNKNKLNLLKRFSAQDISIITGNPDAKANINPEVPHDDNKPVIKPELIKLIEEGKGDEVPVFASWGRCDTQKGLDVALDAFEKYAKTEEGKNAVLILGAGLNGGDESNRVEAKVKKLLTDPELEGRVVHIDGWAPAYALASASDAAIFPSRFEPCGLTDFESMKYYCTPIVTNTQGLKQKNFDPRNENEKDIATSYKTQHEFNLTKDCVNTIIDAYGKNDKEAVEKVKKEFPIFFKKDENGNETFDDTAFKKFAKSYSEYITPIKEQLDGDTKEEKEQYEKFIDWDNLSKDYDFKYNGFARDFKDAVLSAELADAISSFTTADQNEKETIFKNHKNLDTTWNGNNSSHPDSGKSSKELYKEKHMSKDYEDVKKDSILKMSDKNLDKNIEEKQTNDLNSRAKTFGAGALGAALATILSRTQKNLANEETQNLINTLQDKVKTLEGPAGQVEGLKNQIKELTEANSGLDKQIKALAKSKNKTIAIVGVAAAAAAALITFGVTKVISNKKNQGTLPASNAQTQAPTPQAAPAPAPVQVQTTAPQAPAVQQTTAPAQPLNSAPAQPKPIEPVQSVSPVQQNAAAPSVSSLNTQSLSNFQNTLKTA